MSMPGTVLIVTLSVLNIHSGAVGRLRLPIHSTFRLITTLLAPPPVLPVEFALFLELVKHSDAVSLFRSLKKLIHRRSYSPGE